MGQSRPLFVYFRSFLIIILTQIEKSIDGVLEIRTRGRRMVGADKSHEAMAATLNFGNVCQICEKSFPDCIEIFF